MKKKKKKKKRKAKQRRQRRMDKREREVKYVRTWQVRYEKSGEENLKGVDGNRKCDALLPRSELPNE